MIEINTPGAYVMSASQSPGKLAPSFNVKIFPDGAGLGAEWLNYEAPPATISIHGVEYQCIAEETSVLVDPNEGVDIEAQYSVEEVVKLREAGPDKTLVFLSCLPSELAILEGKYDEETHEVLSRSCNVYTDNGWTVNQIIEEVGNIAGVLISAMFPPLHVPNPTVILPRGKKYLPFIKSLLPPGFEFVYTIIGGVFTISLLRPGNGAVSFIPGTYRMQVTRRRLPAYDLVEIRGGDAKWGSNVMLGRQSGLGSSSTSSGTATETIELDPEERETENGIETIYVEQTWRLSVDDETHFALLGQVTTETGPKLVSDGTQHEIVQTRRMAEVFTYENIDPRIFEEPRQAEMEMEVETFYCYVASEATNGIYQSFFLTEDGQIISKAEYDLMVVKPVVTLSAYQVYGLAEKNSEIIDWVQPEDADENWREGTRRTHTVSKERIYCEVNGQYYDALTAPRDLLERILVSLFTNAEQTMGIVTVSNGIWKEVEGTAVKLTLLGGGMFQYEETTREYDDKADEMVKLTVKRAVSGSIPRNASVYRTETLIASLSNDDSGIPFLGAGGSLRIPFSAEIPTNNVEDFELWGGMLYEQAISQSKKVSLESYSRFLPPGMEFGGVTMKSFQTAKGQSGESSIVMGGM